MSDDPMRLGGLDAEAIEKAVSKRSKKPESEEAKIRADTNAKREERLQSKAIAPPPPPKPPPEPEVVPDRSALLDKLGQYKERFPNLKSRNKIGGRSSVEEIEDEIHYCEQQLGTKDGHMGTQLFIATMAGIEHVTSNYYNPLGLNLTGLGTVSRDNQAEFAPIIDELMIKYGASMYVSPEMRLVGVMGTLMYTVHAANSGDVRTAAALEKMRSAVKMPPTDL